MKRFITVVSRLFFVAAVAVAFILLGILVMRMEDLSTQVAALSTRVHELKQVTPVSVVPGRGSQTGGAQAAGRADVHVEAEKATAAIVSDRRRLAGGGSRAS